MNRQTFQLLDQFITDYKDEKNHGDLYLGAESYSINDVADMLQNPEYDIPKNVKNILENIWNDRVGSKTLLGSDDRSEKDIHKLANLLKVNKIRN